MAGESKTSELSSKQARFVEEYLVDLNGTQAAIRAGYSENGASVQGHRLLSNANIQAAVTKARTERSKRTEITADRVLQEFALLGFANMEDYIKITEQGEPYVDLTGMSREQAAAISEVTVDDYVEGRGEDARQVKRVRIKFHDKKGALHEIAKHLGMYTEQFEHTIKGPLVIVRGKSKEEDDEEPSA